MRTILIGLVLASAVLWAAEEINLNVKTGLWDVTTTTTSRGAMPISPELLARLTPEQRARVEERMKANAGKPSTHASQYCLTKEKLEEGPQFSNEQKGCKQTIVSSTSSNLEVKVSCERPNDVRVTGAMKFDALNSENVKGSGEFSFSQSGKSMNSNYSLTAKWVGSACSDK